LNNRKAKMRLAIFGVGAVGGYLGWRLVRAGQDVVFIARGGTLEALQTQGLRVDTLEGTSEVVAVNAVQDPSSVGPVDAVLLGVKAWQVPEAAEAARTLMGPESFVVPLQNGVEAPSLLAEVLGPQHVFGGLCYMVALKVGAARVRHAGLEPRVIFGEMDNRVTERSERLLAAFAQAGVKAEIPRDIHAAMWNKFLFIATFSSVAAVTRAPAGVIRSIPETRRMLEAAASEVAAVAAARGVRLEESVVQSVMELIDNLPDNGTASMQRDIMEGRPSELAAQTGAVVRLGIETGVPAPVNSFIHGCLLPQELRARGEIAF
jgi:2-dehydropantoate 2-reductase